MSEDRLYQAVERLIRTSRTRATWIILAILISQVCLLVQMWLYMGQTQRFRMQTLTGLVGTQREVRLTLDMLRREQELARRRYQLLADRVDLLGREIGRRKR